MKKIRNGHGVKASFATCIVAASSLMLGHAETTVFDSLMPAGGGLDINNSRSASYSAAQGFKATGSGYLTSIVLDLYNESTPYHYNYSGPLTVDLYSASGPGGTPGTELTSFSGPSGAGIDDGDYTFTPNSSLWIETGTDYDVVVEDSGLDSLNVPPPRGYEWFQGNTTEGIFEGSYEDTNASGWANQGNTLAMEVTVTPEPGTVALAGAGAVGLLIARRRRQ